MFNLFNRNKDKALEGPHYDPTKISIQDLRKGWMLEYDLQQWEAQEEYEYDWGNNDFSYEFKLVNSENKALYLAVEEDDELRCVVSEKLTFGKLPNASYIRSQLLDKDQAPDKLDYEGQTYYLDSEAPGFFRNIKDENFEEFYYWEYLSEDEEKLLVLEQWGDKTLEAAHGQIVPERAFANILPENKNDI